MNTSAGSLLNRFHAVLAGASDPALGRVPVAVLGWLADYANSETGLAWPGMGTLARLCNCSRRTVINAIKSLVSKGYIERTSRGGPAVTNRYRLTFKGIEAVANRESAIQSRDGACSVQTPSLVTPPSPGGLVNSDSLPSEASFTSLVKSAAHPSEAGFTLSTDEPAHKAGEEVGGFGTGALGGAALAPGATSDFAAFWEYFPKRDVAKTEKTIREKLSQGHSLEVMVKGAAAYKKYCESTNRKEMYRKSAHIFVRDEHYFEDWSVREKPKRSTQTKEQSSAQNEDYFFSYFAYDQFDDIESDIFCLLEEAGLIPADDCETSSRPLAAEHLLRALHGEGEEDLAFLREAFLRQENPDTVSVELLTPYIKKPFLMEVPRNWRVNDEDYKRVTKKYFETEREKTIRRVKNYIAAELKRRTA